MYAVGDAAICATSVLQMSYKLAAVAGGVVSAKDGMEMTKRELNDTLQALEKTRKTATQSKKAALEHLRKLGMLDSKGNLTAHYREDRVA